MKKTGLIAIAFATGMALVPAGMAQAADTQGAFALRGIGSQSCAAYGKAVKETPNITVPLAASWLTGYMTAFNRFEPNTYDVVSIMDIAPLLQIITGVCEKNPNLPMENVARDVLKRLDGTRAATETPLVEAKSGGKSVQVRKATLAAMQAKLSAQGMFKGSADGTFGPATEAALKQYQTAQKLPVTGIPDAPTMIRLLVEAK
jgi:hypothetical protein